MADLEHKDSRLTGWREIGAYLGRAPRTVQRWERDFGLPVHRSGTGRLATIVAYTGEIDAWLLTSSAAGAGAGTHAERSLETEEPQRSVPRVPRVRRSTVAIVVGAVVLTVLAVVATGNLARSGTTDRSSTSPLADASAVYHLDEGGGNELRDTNLAFPGRATGRVTNGAWTPGVVGRALDFGESDKTGRQMMAVFPGAFPFHLPGDVSLSFWVRPVDGVHRTLFWTRGDTHSPDANRFHIYSGGTKRMDGPAIGVDYGSSSGAFHLLFEVPVRVREWTHVALVRKGLTTYTIYLNGERAETMDDANPQLPDYRTDWALWRTDDYPLPAQNGAIDEIALWTRALTAAEVRSLARRTP